MSVLLIVLASVLVCAGATNEQPIIIKLEASARADSTTPSASKPTKSSPYASCGVGNHHSFITPNSGWPIANDKIRIVRGDEALPNEFPWQAYLHVQMVNNKNYSCGGTLIADRWILTATNCLVVPG